MSLTREREGDRTMKEAEKGNDAGGGGKDGTRKSEKDQVGHKC